MGLGILTGNALGIISPTGQSWNTPTYNACMGYSVQQCGSQGYQAGWSTAQVTACIDTAQQKCIAQAKSALTSVLTSSQVTALQQAINTALKKYNYCPIGVDGSLGPETCGASAWAAGTGAPVSVPGPCGKTIAMGTGFLQDCSAPVPVPASLSLLTPVPAAKPGGGAASGGGSGGGPALLPPPLVVPVTKPKLSTANLLITGGVIAAVAVVGYAVAKKKGWIKS